MGDYNNLKVTSFTPCHGCKKPTRHMKKLQQNFYKFKFVPCCGGCKNKIKDFQPCEEHNFLDVTTLNEPPDTYIYLCARCSYRKTQIGPNRYFPDRVLRKIEEER